MRHGASAPSPRNDWDLHSPRMLAPDPAPQLGFGLEMAAEFLGAGADHGDAEEFHLVADGGFPEHRDHVGVELADDFGRRLCRNIERVPRRHVEARQRDFRHRRQFRRRRESLRGGDREAAHLAVPHQRERGAEGVEGHVDAPANDIGHGRPGATIRDVGHSMPARRLNSSPARWGEVPVPDDANVVLPPLPLAKRMNSATVWPARRRNRHEIGIGRNQRHRREIGERIIAERRKQKAIDRKGQRAEQDGVAVGRRMGDRLGADIGAAAALVLDDDLVARGFRQAGREDAGDGVGSSAGNEGDDDPHQPLRPIPRNCRWGGLRLGAMRPRRDRTAQQ